MKWRLPIFQWRVPGAAVRQPDECGEEGSARISAREETARFIAFRSHWGFRAEFCTPGEGHEKGGVEGEAGYFRRNHWVPVPEAANLADLNEQLLAAAAWR